MIDRNLNTLLDAQPAAQTLIGELSFENFSASLPEILFAAFLATLIGLILAERRRPRFMPGKAILRRSYYINLGTYLFNDVVLSLCQVPVLYVLAAAYSGHGLLSGMQDGPAKLFTAFILLDLTLYAWHSLCHHNDFLWVFHKTHHADRSVNVTTGLRYHLGEMLLEAGVRAAFIVVVGVNFETLLVCQGMMTLFILFHHSNLHVPGENWLGLLIVTPGLHRLHHSAFRSEHDSNYGAVFSLWDRLFGTLKIKEPRKIGLAGEEADAPLAILKQFALPQWPASAPNLPAVKAIAAQPAWIRRDDEDAGRPANRKNG